MRSVLKTLSYGGMHFFVAMSVAYVLTRDWRAALAIGLIEPAVQTVAYAMHERAWAGRLWPRRRAASGERSGERLGLERPMRASPTEAAAAM